MTVTPTGGTNLPANMDDLDTGLDEFGMEDAVVPRLTIVHKEGVFQDSLSGDKFDDLKVIMLGLVKQRTLWHNVVDEGDRPMCRSMNHETGWPIDPDGVKKDKQFPWAESGFRESDFPPDADGFVSLPCDGCKLKEWGSHPDGKKPYCAEVYTIPVLYDPYDDEGWVPALMSFQKTGLKPLKSYLTSFSRSRNAAYSAITKITLTLQHRGSNDYSTPNFNRVGDTDQLDWRGYSMSYRQLREFLHTPPTAPDVEVETKNEVKEEAPASRETETVGVSEESASPPASSDGPSVPPEDDDDLPF